MTTTVEQITRTAAIRWLRIVVGAVLLEFALVAVLVPIGITFGEPFITGSTTTGNHTVFFTAVPVACLVFGYIAGRLVVRNVSTRGALHGLLLGVAATAFYLVMTAGAQGGLAPAIAGYGATLFWVTQLLRIVGTTAGAVLHGQP
jgi:hypothetical protein